MKIKQLEFSRVEGNSTGYISIIKEFNTCYCIYTDRDTGRVISSSPNRKKTEHNSFDDAKKYCQIHFDNIIKSLLDK